MTLTKPWYHRILSAIKYIFKFKSKWGHWSETVLSYDDMIELRDFLNERLNNEKK